MYTSIYSNISIHIHSLFYLYFALFLAFRKSNTRKMMYVYCCYIIYSFTSTDMYYNFSVINQM